MPRCLLPSRTTVRADLQGRDALVRIDHLHTEPVGRDAVLVVELQRRRDGAVDEVPGDGDDALGLRGEGGEGVGEEVEVVQAAAGALVNDLAGIY